MFNWLLKLKKENDEKIIKDAKKEILSAAKNNLEIEIVPSESKNQLSSSLPIKREKGKSLLVQPSSYIVLDLETTGLSTQYDDIIEVAAIKYINGNETEQFHSLVRPEKFTELDDFITELTGITDDMLRDAPTFRQILPDFQNFVKDYVIIGHNVNFDINFLYDNILHIMGTHFQNNFIDTMRLSRIVLPDLCHHRLKDICDYFEIAGNHHRALDDCYLTQDILLKLYQLAKKNNINLQERENYKYKAVDLRSLTGDTSLNDPTNLFYDKNVVFTGKLSRFSRKDAAQIVVNIGGHCENNVTKKTNFLVMGDLDHISNVKNGKSTKQKKAEKLILEGQPLQIITESTFYDLIEDSFNE